MFLTKRKVEYGDVMMESKVTTLLALRFQVGPTTGDPASLFYHYHRILPNPYRSRDDVLSTLPE